MRILVLGDFGVRDAAELPVTAESLASLRPRLVDIDNLERLLGALAPTLHPTLDVPSRPELSLTFSELDDFHPDSLYSRLTIFEPLRALHRRLQNPETFAAAAEQVRRLAQASALPVPEPEAPGPAVEADAATLGRLLGRQPTGTGPRAAEPGGIEQFIQGIVAPHVVPDEEPYADVYLAAVDRASAELMQALLHHPEFQDLEAAWRSLQWLIGMLETGEDLQVHMLDVSRAELVADLVAAEPGESRLFRLLVEAEAGTPGGEPWSLLVANFAFGAAADDISLLGRLGTFAAHAGGPLLAAAAPGLLGCPSAQELQSPDIWAPLDDTVKDRWQALRRSEVARWIGLALPRVLLRLPYGERGEAIDAFDFEELPPDHQHQAFLWGNPAFVCAWLLGRAYQARGWSMAPGDGLDIPDLPAYTYTEAGESKLLPCAEVLLSERVADAVLGRGMMPMLSYRNRNAVRLMRFQSIAEPLSPLAGPWA